MQQYGISERDFVNFIDTLNVVSAASPPFKILDLTGGLIGMVPHHWAQATSHIMKLAATGGTAVVSKSRTDAFLAEANRAFFGSRRLRVCLITTDALKASVGFPAEKTIALPLALDVPVDQQPGLHDRLLRGLHGYISDTVPTQLPPTNENNSVLDRLSANQVARDVKGIDKKVMKESEKELKKMKKKSGSNSSSAGEGDGVDRVARSNSLNRKFKKVEEDIKKVNREAAKHLASGKQSSARTEVDRTKALLPLLKKQEDLYTKEAKAVKGPKKASSEQQHRKKAKKGSDEKFVARLLWVLITEVPSGSEE